MTLKWKDHKAVPHTITCPLDPRNNVASICAHTTDNNKDFDVFVCEAELEDDLNPCCMACSAPVDSGTSAVVTDDECEFSDTSSDLNHADVDLVDWDGDFEFTWHEGDGNTVITAASMAADSINSAGLILLERGPLASHWRDLSPNKWSTPMRRRGGNQAFPPSSCGFTIHSTTSPSTRSR
jgi:hypothetical protein